MKKNFIDIVIVVVSAIFIIVLLNYVANSFSSKTERAVALNRIHTSTMYRKDMPYAAQAQAMWPGLVTVLDKVKWYDILWLIIAWSAGVFFNKSLHRLVNRIYESIPEN